MRMITDKMYYGNPRFGVEFDSGSETWSNQLTVWIAERPTSMSSRSNSSVRL